MKTLKQLQGLATDKVAKAIEADAGESLPGLREALAEAKAGQYGAVHTPKQIAARKPGRPAGSVKVAAKVSTTLRLDPDVLEAFKSQGAGWQTRINDVLREDLKHGRIHRAKV
ncbi:BrnA antitoxin family protein [Comamonas sediminis]|uniref:BrnA antitoxin family protein n=1 Tax=Comamonas sediminis TaxID=1783360 RepID=A0ABV4B265_9BURK